MIFLRDAETTRIATPHGNQSTPLATPSLGAADVTVVRQRQEPGGFNPVHSHDREEIMVMLAGHVRLTAGEVTADLEARDVAILPAGRLHRVDNQGPDEAEWLIISPAGMRFFRESGEEAIPAWIA